MPGYQHDQLGGSLYCHANIPFAVTAFLALILNLMLDEEIEDEAIDITADTVDVRDDEEEWAKIRRSSKSVGVENTHLGSGSSSNDQGTREKI